MAKVVMAVGVAVKGTVLGPVLALRLRNAITNEIVKCQNEGITLEENSSLLHERMMVAHQRELDAIRREAEKEFQP